MIAKYNVARTVEGELVFDTDPNAAFLVCGAGCNVHPDWVEAVTEFERTAKAPTIETPAEGEEQKPAKAKTSPKRKRHARKTSATKANAEKPTKQPAQESTASGIEIPAEGEGV